MSNPIDPTAYLRPPRLAVDTGLSLAKMLLTVIPARTSPGVRLAAKALADAISALEAAWSTHGRPKPARSARAADLRLDRAWSAVHARLGAWTIFPDDDPDRRASLALTERLFAEGLEFLKLPFLAEHAQSERRLRIIEAEELGTDLDQLVGEPFMDELVQAHAAYGEALDITTPAEPVEPKEPLIEPLRVLTDAITGYAIQIVAYAGLGEDYVAPARRALQPIDDFRAAARGRVGAGRREGEGVGEDEDEIEEGRPEGEAGRLVAAVG